MKKIFIFISVCILMLSVLTGCEGVSADPSVKLAVADLYGNRNQNEEVLSEEITSDMLTGEPTTESESEDTPPDKTPENKPKESTEPILEEEQDIEETPTNTPNNTTTSTVAKYSVDTILGGIGKGIVDGNVSKAKISNVLEIAVDGQNDIFFIDEGVISNEYSDTPYLRKLSVDSKTVETAIIKKDMLNDDELKSPKKILYDEESDSVFILCDNAYERYLALFQMDVNNIDAATKIAGISDKFNVHGETWSVFSFASQDSFIVHTNQSNAPLTFEVSKTGEIEKIEGLLGGGVKAIIPDDNGMFVIHDDSGLKLAYAQLFPRKSTDIKLTVSIKNLADAVAYDGYFYAMTSKGIYKIETSGEVSIFIDFKDLTFNDGNSGYYSKFAFDNGGNVIVFDYGSGSLRRINVN